MCWISAKLQLSLQSLEHAVPEQMFVNAQNPGEAISAVKALQKANALGQRIYHITPANQAATLPNIHQNSLVMEEIRNALNAGKEVITHTDAVSVPGWKGAGYILFDPQTGDGAFKIGGGQNGAVLMVLGFVLMLALFASPYAAPLTLITVAMIAPAFAIAIGAMTLGFAWMNWNNPQAAIACNVGIGLIFGYLGLYFKEIGAFFALMFGTPAITLASLSLC
jgi:hypothetical protein